MKFGIAGEIVWRDEIKLVILCIKDAMQFRQADKGQISK